MESSSFERSEMRALTLGIILALGLCGCESKVTSCRSNGVETCSCVAESHYPDDNTCGPASDTASICCALPTWPKTGTCTCRSYYCVNDQRDDGGVTACHCNSVVPDGGIGVPNCALTPPPDGGAAHCCLATTELGSKFACTCGKTECAAGTTEVTSCTPASLADSVYCDVLGAPEGEMPGATEVATCR